MDIIEIVIYIILIFLLIFDIGLTTNKIEFKDNKIIIKQKEIGKNEKDI